MTMKSKTRIAAAMALALSAMGAHAAITNSNANFGNSSALFVAMDSASTKSLVIDLGVSMADFVGTINGVNTNAGLLSAAGTVASWNFGGNTRTVNGVEVAGDYAWSSVMSSFFNGTDSSSIVWGVIGADNVTGAASGTNALTGRNLLATGAPTEANLLEVVSPAAISSSVGSFQNFVAAQGTIGTHGGNDDGASMSTSGPAFLNDKMGGTFSGQIPWSYLSAADTTSNLFLINQRADPMVFQLGGDIGEDSLLTANMATFRYDSATNTLNFVAAAPVPEPETYAMLVAGLAAIGAVVRRRKQQR